MTAHSPYLIFFTKHGHRWEYPNMQMICRWGYAYSSNTSRELIYVIWGLCNWDFLKGLCTFVSTHTFGMKCSAGFTHEAAGVNGKHVSNTSQC